MLILVVGLPGTGKTALAHCLASKIKAVHLNSDIIRTAMAKRGDYSLEAKQLVYNSMFELAKRHLLNGQTAIVDATFYKSALRKRFSAMAARCGKPVKLIEVQAAEEVVRERLEFERDFSEADFDVYLIIQKKFEPLVGDYLTIKSDQLSLSGQVEIAQEYILGKSRSRNAGTANIANH